MGIVSCWVKAKKDGAEVWGRFLLASLAFILTIGYYNSTLSLIVLDKLC